MTEANNNSQVESKPATASASADFQEGTDIDNAAVVNHESGLDSTQAGLQTTQLKLGNKHATNSLVARMLWGHEEKVSLNARVSEDGTLDLNDDIR